MFQSCELGVQIYLADPVLMILGTREQRAFLLAMLWWTTGAPGAQVAWAKGSHGLSAVWIGGEFTLDFGRRAVVGAIPAKMASAIREDAQEFMERTVVPYRRLRSFAGRLSWAATIVPRTRWAVTVLYNVVADEGGRRQNAARRGKQKGEKKRGRAATAGLVHTSRMALALLYIAAFWARAGPTVAMVFYPDELPAELIIIVDFSP